MSFFKQAQNTILSTIYKRQDSLSKPKNVFVDDTNKRQKNAQNIIDTSPTSAKGYFLSGQLYQEQNDLHTALIIYLQGLQRVSQDDPQYALMQQKKQKLATKIKQRNQDAIFSFLPFEVFDLIFINLGFQDLLQCTCVCTQWFNFLVEWPKFWGILSSAVPKDASRSILASLLRGQAQELRLEGPLDCSLIHYIFSFLGSWQNNNFVQTIYLEKLDMSTSDLLLLSSAIRCMSTSLKQIELVNCSVKHDDIMQTILPACSSTLFHVAFLRRNIAPVAPKYAYYHSNSVHQQFTIILKRIPLQTILSTNTSNYYSTLTYLKVDSAYKNDPKKQSKQKNLYIDTADRYSLITELIKKSPNLSYLSLGVMLSTNGFGLKKCIQQAIKSCPLLIELAISGEQHIPQIIISNDVNEGSGDGIASTDSTGSPSLYTKITSSTMKAKQFKKSSKMKYQIMAGSDDVVGLHRFVYAGYIHEMKESDIIQIFKKFYTSLEFLYLVYDGYSVSGSSLYKLASYGCPNLREIHVSTNAKIISSVGYGVSYTRAGQALLRLLSACPTLESIELRDDKWSEPMIRLDGTLVETIVKKCPRLQLLRIITLRNIWWVNGEYSCKAFLSLIDKNYKSNNDNDNDNDKIKKGKEKEEPYYVKQTPCQLICLKVSEMDHETAYTLVKNLTSLMHLYIKWWVTAPNETLVQEMKNILTQRGGALVVGEA
ncbi:hypothetical protein BDA99DRAFT_39988 [Phascolomyces articulosus]|uniref:F-box domain-containing protein n=1 Tax=Phascolomyces articulosus TaxID=60185 RepID=A0AAD5PET0_9FUNG|nr:hypothetical protein BDA99DRAFT_39988 [Phascolomyces articulosus]